MVLKLSTDQTQIRLNSMENSKYHHVNKGHFHIEWIFLTTTIEKSQIAQMCHKICQSVSNWMVKNMMMMTATYKTSHIYDGIYLILFFCFVFCSLGAQDAKNTILILWTTSKTARLKIFKWKIDHENNRLFKSHSISCRRRYDTILVRSFNFVWLTLSKRWKYNNDTRGCVEGAHKSFRVRGHIVLLLLLALSLSLLLRLCLCVCKCVFVNIGSF